MKTLRLIHSHLQYSICGALEWLHFQALKVAQGACIYDTTRWLKQSFGKQVEVASVFPVCSALASSGGHQRNRSWTRCIPLRSQPSIPSLEPGADATGAM